MVRVRGYLDQSRHIQRRNQRFSESRNLLFGEFCEVAIFMKIYCFVPDAYGGHGGISVFNRDLLNAFTLHPMVESVTALPLVMSRPMEPLPQRLLFRAKAANSFSAYIRTLIMDLPRIARSDMLYCGHLNYAPLVRGLGRLFGVPVLGALYGIDAWTASDKRMRRNAALGLDKYFAISAYTKSRFLEWANIPSDKICFLPNAIHLSEYSSTLRPHNLVTRFGLSAKNKVLLTFGRLVSRERAKGFDEVLDVLPQLVQGDPNLRYIIAGDGPDLKRLERRVIEAGLFEHVIFTGFVEEHEKSALYNLADLYVMPSRGEGFGFVFLEALACGVPVVASSVDGSRDAVRDGLLGQMVNPDDPEALIMAIRRGLKMSKSVPQELSYFDFPEFVRRAHALVDATVASSR
jgi:phosphatidylinositol alpha-1,6-mannosyltransferase